MTTQQAGDSTGFPYFVKLKYIMEVMKIVIVLEILFASVLSALEGPGEIRGSVGTSVTATCKNKDKSISNNHKYWCKGYYSVSCDVLIQTNGSEVIVHRDRMSISDNQTIQEFTITLQNLTLNDTGWYWCGVSKPHRLDVMHSIKLSITEAPPVTVPPSTDSSIALQTTYGNLETSTFQSDYGSSTSNLCVVTSPPKFTNLPILAPVAVLLFLLLLVAVITTRKLQRRSKLCKS
ncbi:CMRF35-like molecule 1 [Protopterus annectens]|uniref:CMRF35-like molecule 1 n=1 Tax=Protopterus annectens TaxID=7888 RepID=UPI001CF93D79|nr:CMRF35-like molecule 1 [Protopterus annectens]